LVFFPTLPGTQDARTAFLLRGKGIRSSEPRIETRQYGCDYLCRADMSTQCPDAMRLFPSSILSSSRGQCSPTVQGLYSPIAPSQPRDHQRSAPPSIPMGTVICWSPIRIAGRPSRTVLDFPLKCTPRLRARANYIQNRENSLLLKFNNYISNKDINFLS
jgi:hypothetical protein